MKVISVLYYPFENEVVIRVTRAPGFFSHPQQSKTYKAPYGTSRAESLFHWYQELQRLTERKIFESMEGRYR